MPTSTSTTVVLKGRSGAAYEFTVYPWRTECKPIGGVYAVLKLRTDDRYDVLYIGETGNLSERFDSHHKAQCFDRNGKTHLGVCTESSQQRRLTIERDLIDNYKPPCNGE